MNFFVCSPLLVLSVPDRNIFLVLYGFSFVVDRSWPFSKIAPVDKVYKWGENGFFRKP
jgi:hypothetical protein